MEDILQRAIHTAQTSEIVYTKFITPNDTGATGGHQAGYHINKKSWNLFFDTPGIKGENKDKYIAIKWQDDFETTSRFIYYGTGTRNEYRLTRFGRGFPFLNENNVGDLLILCKITNDNYKAYVLQTDDDIENFLAAVNLSTTTTDEIIQKESEISAEDKLIKCFSTFLDKTQLDFPPTSEIASNARNCYNSAYNIQIHNILKDPDGEILQWLNAEFQLFKLIENDRYKGRIKTPFSSVEELIEIANTILNRRKSRAGKSLEHHLSEVFNIFSLAYSTQAITEENKKPDFLFPGQEAYANSKTNSSKLIMLAAKTTCKDRWRQILNEADRIKTKHLFTLQQGISKNQLTEMYKYGVCLVVPDRYISSFPKEYRDKIFTLQKFIEYVQSTQQ